MKPWRAWLGQGALYGLFAAFIGVFSQWPSWQVLPPGQAVLKVSFIHHGQRVAPCRPYTPEELAKLPPQMRAPQKCERERAPVLIEVDVDGVTVVKHLAQPAGLSRDGASTVYRRLAVPAGEHRIVVRMKDGTGDGFDHVRETTLRLKEAQVLVIDFDPQKGGITLS